MALRNQEQTRQGTCHQLISENVAAAFTWRVQAIPHRPGWSSQGNLPSFHAVGDHRAWLLFPAFWVEVKLEQDWFGFQGFSEGRWETTGIHPEDAIGFVLVAVGLLRPGISIKGRVRVT